MRTRIPFLAAFLSFALALGGVSYALAAPDTTPPTVGLVSPTLATTGVVTVYTANYSDNSDAVTQGVIQCQLVVDGGKLGDMALSDYAKAGTATYTYAFPSDGTHLIHAQCQDFAGNWRVGSDVTVTSETPGIVGSVSPTTPTVNQSTTFSANYSGFTAPKTASGCWLVVDGATTYPEMTLSNGAGSVSGTASKAYTFTSTGSHTVFVSCLQTGGTYIYGIHITVTVGAAADTTPPTVGQIPTSSATAGVAISLGSTVSDNVGVTQCNLFIGGADQGTMTVSGGTAMRSYTFASGGTYMAWLVCRDAAGNSTQSISRTISVSGSAADTSPPTVTSLWWGVGAIAGTPIILQANYGDNVGVVQCDLYVDGAYRSSMNLTSGQTANVTYTFPNTGSYSISAHCRDAAGNSTSGVAQVIAVTASAASDTTPPAITAVQQDLATAGVPIMLTANVADANGVASCDLYVDYTYKGSMTVGSQASRSYTFPSSGSYLVSVNCRDAAGNLGTGPTRTVTVSGSTSNPPPTNGPVPGSLIKLVCSSGASTNDPCKAVYFYGSDGKRHAFPNERVFFTWYSNFNNVNEVSQAFLSSLPLGINVTYRPGIKMVKFTTLNRVYAVGRHGVLRWVTSESVATALYGPSWNRLIDDISDTFFGNYSFGTEIGSTADYNPTSERNAAPTIDANL